MWVGGGGRISPGFHLTIKFQMYLLPDGCVFLSKLELSISNACGVKDVRRFLFFDVSTPIKSVKGFSPILNLSMKL